ncbi:hypothetical protein HDZ31DRAFT_44768 [Schizophyllum fasciatum]
MQAAASTSATRGVKRASKPALSLLIKPSATCTYTEVLNENSQCIVIPPESEFHTPSTETRHFSTPFVVSHHPMCIACDDGECADMEDGPRTTGCFADQGKRPVGQPRRDGRITSCHPLIDVESCEYAYSCELRSLASPSLVAHLRVYVEGY